MMTRRRTLRRKNSVKPFSNKKLTMTKKMRAFSMSGKNSRMIMMVINTMLKEPNECQE